MPGDARREDAGMRVLVARGLLCGVALVVAGGASAAQPRGLSPAERAGVALAVDYLESGPGGWWERLHPASPLAGLDRDAALAELEVRAGPPRGSTWELQTVTDEGLRNGAVFRIELPSGFHETLWLDLSRAGEEWRIQRIQSLVDGPPSGEPAGAPGPGPEPAAGAASAPRPGLADLADLAPWLLLGASALLGGLALLQVRRRRPAALVLLLLAGLGGTAAWFLRSASPAEEEGSSGAGRPAAAPGFEELRGLLETRRLLADRPTRPELQQLAGELPESRAFEEVTALWSAELALQAGDLDAAEEWLQRLPEPAARPLAEILRGRLALLRGDAVSTALFYQRAIERFPNHDALLLEAAEALSLMEFENRALELLRELAAAGTRKAAVHYDLARGALLRRDEELAASHFREGWALEPLEREEVLRDPLLAHLVRRRDLYGFLGLHEAVQEPTRDFNGSPAPADRLAGLPAVYRGRLLEVEIPGGSRLVVPGGAGLAAESAEPQTPEEGRRREEERLLVALDDLERSAVAGALVQPGVKREIALAARALARRNRWQDLLDLTDGLASSPRQMPTEVASLRADALRRKGLEEEATSLLVKVAQSRVAQRRKDSQALYELGGMLLMAEQYEQAEQVIRLAEEHGPRPPVLSLLPRIRIEARLAHSYLTHRTDSFQIAYPLQTEDYFVQKLGGVLEAELQRLQRWIPWQPDERIEVQLYSFEEFFRAFAPGKEVLGLFDGKVRVPLADLPTLHPVVLSVLTHEVAHALISGASDDQAPRWFQEGLAQHVQPVQQEINPIPDYRLVGTFLSFPLLDAALSLRGDPYLRSIANDEAVWVVHYLEARHGTDAIQGLVDAFGRGLRTEAALDAVLGLSVEEFDRAVWTWCLEEAPAAWPTEEVRYDLGPPRGIRFSEEPDR